MKRSELVEKLYHHILWSTTNVHGVGIKIKNCPRTRKFASELLKIVEEAGMLPPTCELINFPEDSSMEGKMLDIIEMLPDCEPCWEPEEGEDDK